MSVKKKPVAASLSKKFLTYVHEHPDQYPDAEKFISALDEWPEKAARVNTAVSTLEELCALWEQETDVVPWCQSATYIAFEDKRGSSPEHAMGSCYIGDPSAMILGECLDIARDAYVVDMCAAPGGKSAHMLNFLSAGGTLVANDVDPKRARVLRDNLERMCTLIPNDEQPHIEVTSLSAADLAEKYADTADVVILDAPCSGEAMMRRSDMSRRQWSEKLVKKMSMLQKILLSYASTIAREGAVIGYSTCTFNASENEEVIDFGVTEIGLSVIMGSQLLQTLGETTELPLGLLDRGTVLCAYPHYVRGDGQTVSVMKKTLRL